MNQQDNKNASHLHTPFSSQLFTTTIAGGSNPRRKKSALCARASRIRRNRICDRRRAGRKIGKKEEDEIKIEGNKINLQIYVHPLGSRIASTHAHSTHVDDAFDASWGWLEGIILSIPFGASIANPRRNWRRGWRIKHTKLFGEILAGTGLAFLALKLGYH